MIVLLRVLVLVLVLGQRFAVSIGGSQVAAVVPVLTLLAVVGYCAGLFSIDRRRLILVATLVGSTALIAALQIVIGEVPSMLSVALLAVLYAPAVLRPTGDRRVAESVGRFFVGLMAIAAVLSIAQYAIQSAGLTWTNYISTSVPPSLILQDFNDGNPIVYGSDVNRATALVFLEPSFLSLFLGIAVVIAIGLRMRWPVVTLLLLGIVPTVAGNGLVVVGAAVIVQLFGPSARRLLTLLPAALLAVTVGLLTPLGQLYIGRATEGGGTNSSSGLRFVQPYVVLIPPPLEHTVTALIGIGAGTTKDFISANFPPTTPLLATVLPKIVYEFGLAGVVGMLVPLAILLLGPLRRRPELAGLGLAFFVVNGSLLTPLMVYLAILVLLWLPDLSDNAPSRSMIGSDLGPSRRGQAAVRRPAAQPEPSVTADLQPAGRDTAGSPVLR